MRVEMQRFIVTFLPTLLLFFGIKRLSHILYIFLYINNKNSQQCFPKIVTYSLLAYIFCIFSKVRDLCVRIRQTGYGGTFSSNLGLNVWRNQPEIATHSNTVVKVRQFSTECTNAFIANVYIKSKKIVISYRMSVRSSFLFIQIGTSPVLQHHFTGVRTVSPTAGLDRVVTGWCTQVEIGSVFKNDLAWRITSLSWKFIPITDTIRQERCKVETRICMLCL